MPKYGIKKPSKYQGFYRVEVRVSLTYLRGLEIADLKEEDMPMV